jgi:phage-related protein
MPAATRYALGVELLTVQHGGEPKDWRAMPEVGAGMTEIRHRDENGAFRVPYVAKFAEAVYVLCAARFSEENAKNAQAGY